MTVEDFLEAAGVARLRTPEHSAALERVRRPDIPSARYAPADVPRLRDGLLEAWSGGLLLELLTAHSGRGARMHLPTHHRDEARGVNVGWSIMEWRDWLLEQLAVAELFYVTADMTELVTQAAAAKPRYQVFADKLPAPVGFVVYGKPYCVVPPEGLAPGQRVELTAALWAPVPDTGGTASGPQPGIMVVTLQDSDVLLWTQPVSHLTVGASPSALRSVLEGMRRQYGPIAYHEEYPLPYGDQPWDEQGLVVQNGAIAAMMTTWTLMGQRLTEESPAPVPRHVRKAAARAGRPEPKVRLVDLRRRRRGDVLPADEQVERDGEPKRKYTKRWPVKGYGYWRNTWYPSKQRHEEQFVWVPEYMKGPEGAPLVGGERVNVLRR